MAKKQSNRCLFKSDFTSFIDTDPYFILGHLHNAFHGQSLTTTDEAWLGEITILQTALVPWKMNRPRLYLNMTFRGWENALTSFFFCGVLYSVSNSRSVKKMRCSPMWSK